MASAAPMIGCGEILGVDDYGVSDAAAPAALPELPARPDETYVKSCVKCARASCLAEREACEQSDPCREMLECKGRCDDPDCLMRCEQLHPRSALFERYYGCVYANGFYAAVSSRCVEQCNVGSNAVHGKQ